MDPLIGFASGIGVSLISALLANVLTRRRDRRHTVEERWFEIYMKLMDLHGSYFWFSTAEFHKTEVPPEVRKRCYDLAWQIADLLRSADEVDFLERTLDVILGPSFPTATKRYEVMGNLIDQVGRKINPKYSKKIREISDANLELLGSGVSSNAPGSRSSPSNVP
jgi:hypothetical protein